MAQFSPSTEVDFVVIGSGDATLERERVATG